ncbi:MAG: hypothetical protein AABY10_03565 [Nanoarchaeota archaeon]
MSLEQQSTHHKNWYDKYYKVILLIPVAILLISLIYLIGFYKSTGNLFLRDSSLSGGTTITLQGDYDHLQLESKLKETFKDVRVRTISDRSTSKNLALIIDSSANPEELKSSVESILGIKIDEKNANIEFSGASLSNSFYKQLIIALIISFILMSCVIFFLFRTFIPSFAVIFAAFADIIMPLAVINYFGVSVSAAGIAAFLMLIGYSVDTDILLTTRVLKKKEGSVNQRIYSSFKTGMFMTITALLAVIPAFILVTTLPDSFRQIFLILSLGLFADIINTWLTNASIIKWYAVKKRLS